MARDGACAISAARFAFQARQPCQTSVRLLAPVPWRHLSAHHSSPPGHRVRWSGLARWCTFSSLAPVHQRGSRPARSSTWSTGELLHCRAQPATTDRKVDFPNMSLRPAGMPSTRCGQPPDSIASVSALFVPVFFATYQVAMISHTEAVSFNGVQWQRRCRQPWSRRSCMTQCCGKLWCKCMASQCRR